MPSPTHNTRRPESSSGYPSPEYSSFNQPTALPPLEITPSSWHYDNPLPEILFDTSFPPLACDPADHLPENSCPICNRTISSTTNSSYSSSVHSCVGSLHRRNQSTGDKSLPLPESISMAGDLTNDEGNRIVIYRSPLSLETVEKSHAPAQTPYAAPRHVIKRNYSCNRSIGGFFTSVFPILSWLPNYDVKGDLLPDIMAGITVLALQIPQGLAYSKLASVPPIYGLYASFFSMIIYSMMATSKHVSMGLYAITSMMCRGVIANFNSDGLTVPPSNIEILITLCFMTGILQLAFGALRLGNLSLLFSDNFLSAFTVGCAILICNSQVSPTIGINFPVDEMDYLGIPSECINTWISIIKHVSESNKATLLLSAGALSFLISIKYYIEPILLAKKCRIKFPIPSDLLIIIITTTISMAVDLKGQYGVDIVGEIPSGFAAPALPRFDLITHLIPDAIIMAAVASVCQVSLAKMASKKYDYPISLDQEFVAYGSTNIFCSFFHCFPTCASLARTSVNENAGTRTQLTSIVCSALLVCFLFFFTTYLAPLPKATLSSIIFVAMIPSLVKVKDLFQVLHVSKSDAFVWLVTLFTVTFLGVNIGIICGLFVSIAIILLRSGVPTSSVKFPFEDTEIYLSPDVYQGLDGERLKSSRVSIFSFHGPLTFLSAATFKSDIRKKVLTPIEAERATFSELNTNAADIERINSAKYQSKLDAVLVDYPAVLNGGKTGESSAELKPRKSHPSLSSFGRARHSTNVTTLILDMAQVITIDITGIELLNELQDDLAKLNIQLFFASCSTSVLSTLERSTFIPGNVPKSDCFLSVHDAVIAAKANPGNFFKRPAYFNKRLSVVSTGIGVL